MTCENCKHLELELAKAQAAMKQLREGLGGYWPQPMDTTALDAAISAAQQPLVDEIQQAVDVLRMQDNAGKGQSHSETTRRAAQALNILDDALANMKEGK